MEPDMRIHSSEPRTTLTRDDLSVGLIGKRVRIESGGDAVEGILGRFDTLPDPLRADAPCTVRAMVGRWEITVSPTALIEVLP